jgi:hypothetical protein
MLLLASSAPLTEEEGARLDQHGLRGSALGKEGVSCNPPLPSWLLKWTALTLNYITEERKALPKVHMGPLLLPVGQHRRRGTLGEKMRWRIKLTLAFSVLRAFSVLIGLVIIMLVVSIACKKGFCNGFWWVCAADRTVS